MLKLSVYLGRDRLVFNAVMFYISVMLTFLCVPLLRSRYRL